MSRPDEGLIHAWLDGELGAGEAARVERLVRDDPEWAAAAAEARGFLAASDRILRALDDVPAGIVPPADAQQAGPVTNADARRGRATPVPWWALRAAAVLVVAAGVAVVMNRKPDVTIEAARAPAGLPPVPGAARAADQAAAPPGVAAKGETERKRAPQLAQREPAQAAEKAAAPRTPGRTEQAQAGAALLAAPVVAGAMRRDEGLAGRVECYRLADAVAETVRVRRLTDSTALADVPVPLRPDSAAAAKGLPPEWRVRGDTLYAGLPGRERPAVRVACSPQ